MKKSVLITGCSSGFGYHSALKFARNDYHVYATSRNLDKDGIRKLREITKGENLAVDILALDVTHQRTIDEVVKKIDTLDVLVNNAGFGLLGPVESFSQEDLRQQMETNFFGVFAMIKSFLPLLKQSKSAKIINLSSLAGLVAAKEYGIYSSSKFALEALSSSLRGELKEFGVNVSLVNPGGFDTEFDKNANTPMSSGGSKTFHGILTRFISKLKLRDPKRVVELIFKIANKKSPKFHNIIGVDASLITFMKKILPDRFFMWMMERVS